MNFKYYFRFDYGHLASRRQILAFFLFHEVDVNWEGEIRRLLELLIIPDYEEVIDFCVIFEDVVNEVQYFYWIVAEKSLAQLHDIFLVGGF